MTLTRLCLVAAVALLPVTLFAADKHEHAHDHAAHGSTATLTLDNGQKWQTDAPLRSGMSAIHRLVARMPDSAAAGKALAGAMRKEVDGIVRNCRLVPKADAVLHVVIGDLVAAANDIDQAATQGAREQGVHHVHRAIGNYTRYFNHPGWPKAE
ncbi:MAG: hypothetical protein OEV31_00205 [Gammaproteobacteria bacterium]|nr:hypothetical protein [Gammaproteobacteria bacterium]